ncbi:hypothetical protein HMPREF1624_02497 [Sporothrix schenckii ATCC 58251]|uniref:FAR1 domain-containing protein n=1 Tax=Sporothrix schenckii (strain ATCC 58251 / de Perez 2211183) TaxID=1391915 RepID=U7Q2K7_SPOS1|nr:hypothetical protein HMPREF1624_02497 [Sporothrix schenckii ATCC 58251]
MSLFEFLESGFKLRLVPLLEIHVLCGRSRASFTQVSVVATRLLLLSFATASTTDKPRVFFPADFSPTETSVIDSTVASASTHPGTPNTNGTNAPQPPATGQPFPDSEGFETDTSALLAQGQTFALASNAPQQPPAWSLGSTAPGTTPIPQNQGTPARTNGTANGAIAASTPIGAVTPARQLITASTPATSPATTTLVAPPEGIYRSFDDLLTAVQRVAKDNGYGIVKLRASNYRDAKPTRYDLVCDRGGVKYNSTAKKRNPSTRKVDCPFRAKAVCEVSLANQWRFVVQESRHNHEARVPAAPPGQEATPIAQNLRSFTNKLDRISHDVSHGFQEMNSRLDKFMESIEKRLEAVEQRLNNNLVMANAMPPNLANGLGGGMPGQQAVLDSRLNNVEARLNAMETRGLDMPLDDVDSRMLSTGVM